MCRSLAGNGRSSRRLCPPSSKRKVFCAHGSCPPTHSQHTRAGDSSAVTRMSGLKSPAKVKCTIAPTPASAFTMVVHHPDSPWAVVSAANTVSRGAVVSNTWWMVFNSSLLRHDGLGGGQHLFGCRDHVVGLAAVFLGRGDQLF